MTTFYETVAPIAYNAYVQSIATIQQKQMAEWAELPERIQQAWIAACKAILTIEATHDTNP